MDTNEFDPFAASPPPTVSDLLLGSIAAHGPRAAIQFVGSGWTYTELGREVFRLAHALLALGVEPSDRVAIWLPNYPEWIFTNLAAASIGAVTVPVNTRFRAQEAAYVLRESAASVLVTTDSFLTNR